MSKSLGFKSFFLSARQSRDGTSRCAFVSCERKTSVTALTPHWSVDCFVRHLTVLSDWLAIPLGRLIDPIACCLGKDGFPFPPAAAVNQLIQHCVSEFRSVCWCVWSTVYPSSPSFPPTKQPAHPPFHYHPPFPHTLGENTLKDFCCCCTWPSSRPQCVWVTAESYNSSCGFVFSMQQRFLCSTFLPRSGQRADDRGEITSHCSWVEDSSLGNNSLIHPQTSLRFSPVRMRSWLCVGMPNRFAVILLWLVSSRCYSPGLCVV